MIKQIKSKFLISLFLLVISIFITSSCYAFEHDTTPSVKFYPDLTNRNTYLNVDLPELPIVSGYNNYYVFEFTSSDTSFMADYRYEGSKNVIVCVISSRVEKYYTLNNDFKEYGYDGFSFITSYCKRYVYDFNNKTWVLDSNWKSSGASKLWGASGWVEYSDTFNWSKMLYSNRDIYAYDNPEFCLYNTSNYGIDDWTYTLKGVERGTVKLELEDFNFEKYTIWGFVDSDLLFNIGERLDSSQYEDKMRLFGINSKHNWCYLYHGEKLCYYMVDNETELIVSCGYINELAEGNFLYGFGNKSNTEVDFVFLRDGKEYWDNSLTFKTSLNGSELDDNYNDIVTIGPGSYFKVPTYIYSCEYIGFVYDNENNLLSNAIVNVFQDRSSDIKFDSVISWYTEDKQALNEYKWGIGTIKLSGKNSDGSTIDFTNYKIKWSIPNNLNINYIIFNHNAKYDKYVGEIVINDSKFLLDLFYVEDFSLTIDIYSKDYVGPFDITFELYNPDGEFVCNYILNSDDIVAEEVEEQKNNVNKEDFNIVNNPNYTGGSSNNNGSNTGLNNGLNINDIQNWGVEDYKNLMSTDNFVWEFFKAILGNLPWWITTPLTILIFGVVIITLIRFARGA